MIIKFYQRPPPCEILEAAGITFTYNVYRETPFCCCKWISFVSSLSGTWYFLHFTDRQQINLNKLNYIVVCFYFIISINSWATQKCMLYYFLGFPSYWLSMFFLRDKFHFFISFLPFNLQFKITVSIEGNINKFLFIRF